MKNLTNILLSLFLFFSSGFAYSQLQLRPLPKAGFEERIKTFVENVQLVDTHEHLGGEFTSDQKSTLDFMFLLTLYADDDIKSAGMGKSEFAELLTDKYTIPEKWRRIKPYWEASKNTAYNRVVLLTIDQLYGIKDLNESTVVILSEKLRNSYNGKWYDYVLKERAKIKYIIQDGGSRRLKNPIFRYVEKFDQFIRIHSAKEVIAIAEKHNMKITDLDSYVQVLQKSFLEAIDRGIIGVKSALAYHRILKYDNTPKNLADSVFKKLIASERELTFEEVKPFQDYIMHQLIQLVGKHDIPFQFHTGLQSGDGNSIDNANPSHMANLFLEYRDVKFVLFHAGFPFGGILSTQAKNFRNVYIDMCWSAVISPSYSERYLHEWLETVPANKIMAFGGDYHNVESTYGHSLMARGIVSNVLIEKVRTGYLTETESLEIAQRLFYDNACQLYKLN